MKKYDLNSRITKLEKLVKNEQSHREFALTNVRDYLDEIYSLTTDLLMSVDDVDDEQLSVAANRFSKALKIVQRAANSVK